MTDHTFSRHGAVTRALAAFAAVAGVAGLVGCSKSSRPTLEATAMASAAAPASSTAPIAAAGGPSDGSTAKPFGAPCVADAECTGGVCFHKRLKGPDAGREHRGADDAVEHDGYCSIRCNDDADCPVPLTHGKCGARGMCKRPD